MTALSFAFVESQAWSHVPVEDPRASALADRHYSRQTVGAKGFVPGGRRFVLLHESESGNAVWAVCLNMDPVGVLQWRNTIFRNESGELSSDLIRSAVSTTYEVWQRRYGELPWRWRIVVWWRVGIVPIVAVIAERIPLTTEIDIAATAARRSKRSRPGRCYELADWVHVRDVEPGHGRGSRSIWMAPL